MRAKFFKNGNSQAVRIPKSLGIAEGTVVDIQPTATGLRLDIVRQSDEAFWDSVIGCVPDMERPPQEPISVRKSWDKKK